ncbi:TonB-dependent receptor plug domain-containing protein [Qipengyuania atrilutea]|uniref:TonB-dependent receptor n=1 Tax=Qipengyuania atrilutea TaxID=2744473 RepID=A0A850H3P2_9SPHN|nr:TonB-dependent receptor [Actirhodobacter atriluteus]NVD45266.1 TonB-dependent receptor [Actirhodobacter atriluteus]
MTFPLRRSIYPLLSAALAGFAQPVFAQDAATDTEEDLPEEETVAETIIVTGRGLPDAPATPAYAMQVIDREEITSSASGRIEDVLASVAGFQQFRRSDSRSSNPSAQGVTLRALGGNATSRALVLLDGVPMADPFFGYIPLPALVPERLASIRVTRGGGSGAFGSGAVAGTIELESADAATLGFASASVLANDRGGTEVGASLNPQLGSGFASVSGRYDRGPGFFTTPVDQRVPATSRSNYDSWSVSLRGVAPVAANTELQARALVFRDERTLRFEGADSSSSGEDMSLRLVGQGAWQFDALGYVQRRDFSNIVISSTRFVPVLDQRKTPSTGYGGKLEVRPPLGPNHVLRVGADYRGASGTLNEEAYSAFSGNLTSRRRAGGTNGDLGLFAEHDWTIADVILTGGVRLDRWSIRDGFYRAVDGSGAVERDDIYADRSGWDTSLRGGILYRPSDVLALRAAAYSGLRVPTLNELYRPFVVFPVVTEANAELANEQLRGYEVGFDLTPSANIGLSLTAFDNQVENAIANVTLEENLRQRRNVDAVRSRGIEAAADARFGAWEVDASIAWTDAEIEGSDASALLDGNRPPQTPTFAGSARLAYVPSADVQIAATLRHVSAQFEDDQETDVLPAATTLDAFAEFGLTEAFSLVLRGENLLDERIVTRNQSGSIDLGVPRTLWAGVRYRIR